MRHLYHQILVLFWVLVALPGQAFAQYLTFYPTTCLPNSGITALPQCNLIAEKIYQCNTSLPLPQRQTCFCSQEVFNALFE